MIPPPDRQTPSNMSTTPYIPESQLIINGDGSCFHLHLRPEQIAHKIMLVGDIGRVPMVASHFDTIECDIANREFHTITGSFQGKRISVVSTGIGCDNVDIVLNELDALANIDFRTRLVKEHTTPLDIVRVGTCGGLQPNVPVGSFVCSVKSIGFDGVLNFYAQRNRVCDLELEQAFLHHMGWTGHIGMAHPYVANADTQLMERIAGDNMVRGITIASCGFYGPQGRKLRIELADPDQNRKIESFTYQGMRIMNYEMESSAVAGLSSLMGHRAVTCCFVVANRVAETALTGYKNDIDNLIVRVLERL